MLVYRIFRYTDVIISYLLVLLKCYVENESPSPHRTEIVAESTFPVAMPHFDSIFNWLGLGDSSIGVQVLTKHLLWTNIFLFHCIFVKVFKMTGAKREISPVFRFRVRQHRDVKAQTKDHDQSVRLQGMIVSSSGTWVAILFMISMM